jgi:hypothetical protein
MINSLYGERPEGLSGSNLLYEKTFGTVLKMSDQKDEEEMICAL